MIFFFSFFSQSMPDQELGKIPLLNNINKNIDNDNDNDFSVYSSVESILFELLTSPLHVFPSPFLL